MRKIQKILFPIGAAILCCTAYAQHPSFSSYEGYKTCKGCHGSELKPHADNVMASLHWSWEKTDSHTGKEVGKYNVINNYCVAVPSNEPRCTSCHIGIGWADNTFDKANQDNIDCLVCHDQSGLYNKTPTGAGAPNPALTTQDYQAIFQSILPVGVGRESCGTCHFYGGGGEGVKHGSMDSSLAAPNRELDVHMGGNFNMDCTVCHGLSSAGSANEHDFVGSRYSKATTDNMLCQSCHSAPVHGGLMDTHAERVACQTCHIPEYARGGKPTKMFWDWTTAGDKNEDGSDKIINDENGYVIYHSKKGTFEWDENVIPEYVWFNGNVTHVTLDDTFSPGQVVKINELQGGIEDANAFIFPVKRFTGIQPYDAGAGTLAIPNLFPYPKETDNDAFWKAYDWEAALTSGMAAVGREFVGPVGYIATEMTWIQNHMVAPKEQALQCVDCHTYGSRLNFAALGYDPVKAEELQLMMQSDFWAGYPVRPDGYADTGSWMGWVYTPFKPWIWNVNLAKYIFVQEGQVTESGGWAYVPK
jgi:octaheme c-type cytochrome (tetrathionate reductase family)